MSENIFERIANNLLEKKKVLIYMKENWSNADWSDFFFVPHLMNPHDLWVIQLLHSTRADN